MTAGTQRGDGERLTRWLNEARRGNKEAFRRLCAPDSWQRWLTAIAVSLPPHLRSRVDPEDVLLETLEQAWRHIGDLKDVSTQGFHRWISSIARHRVADIIRHHQRPRRDVRREDGSPSPSWAGAFRHDHTPSKSVARREQLAKLAALLDELSESYRAVIVYRLLEGYTTREAAETMGKTPDNVRATLHRALTRLRELLERHGIESTIFRPL